MNRPIKLVTLDLDGTLWFVDETIRIAEDRAYDFFAARYPAVAARYDREAFRELKHAAREAHPHVLPDLTALRIACFEDALRASGHDEATARGAAREGFEVFYAARNEVAPFPGARDALDRLGRSFTLAAVSNGNAHLGRIGIADRFAFHLSAADVGAAKPDPAMFHRALERAGASPAEALHVGDDPELDIAAARAVGMQTVWVNVAGAPWPLDAEPGPEARNMDELVAAVEGAGRESAD